MRVTGVESTRRQDRVFAHAQWRVADLQRSPKGADGRSPRPPRHPAGACLPMGDCGAKPVAIGRAVLFRIRYAGSSQRPRPPQYLHRTVDSPLTTLLGGLPTIAIEGPNGAGRTRTARQDDRADLSGRARTHLDPRPRGSVASTRNHLRTLTASPRHHLADPALAARLLGVDADALLHGDRRRPWEYRDGSTRAPYESTGRRRCGATYD